MFGFPPGPARPRTRRIPQLFAAPAWGDSRLWLRADHIQPTAERYCTPYDMSAYGSSVTVRSSGDGQKLLQVPGTPEHLPAWWMGGAAIQAPEPGGSDAPWSVVLVHGFPRRQALGAAMTLWSFGFDSAGEMIALGVTATGYYQLQYGGVATPSTSAQQQSSGIDVCILTNSGTNLGLYINGTAAIYSVALDITSAAAGLVIGDSIGFVAPYDGMVYEVATYPTELSSGDCAAINALLQVQYRTGR